MLIDNVFKDDFFSRIGDISSSWFDSGSLLEKEENVLRSFFSEGNKLSSAALGKTSANFGEAAASKWFEHVTNRSEFFSGISMQSFNASILDEAKSVDHFFSDSRWAEQFAKASDESSRAIGASRHAQGYDKFNYSAAMLERTADPKSATGRAFVESAGGGISEDLGKEYSKRFFGQTKVLREVVDGKVGDVIPAGSRNISAVDSSGEKISGYKNVVATVEAANVGQEFTLENGQKAVVQELTTHGDASIMTIGGRSTTYSNYEKRFSASTSGLDQSEQFRVKLEKKPWLGENPDPNALRV
jgi:hypothetical protein